MAKFNFGVHGAAGARLRDTTEVPIHNYLEISIIQHRTNY
jgi:hypothetical protein